MRKLFLLVFFLSCLNAYAQDKEYKGLIKLYPLNLIGGHINAGYEYILNNNSSLELNGSYYYQDIFMHYTDEKDYKRTDVYGFAIRLNYRGYLEGAAPTGTYYTPQIMFKSVTSQPFERNFGIVIDSVVFHRNVYALKLLVGRQVKLFHNIFIDVYAGGGIRMASGWIDTYYEILKLPYSGEWVELQPSGRSVKQLGADGNLTIHLGVNLSIAL